MSESWIQALSIIGSNLILFLWVRTESRSDHRELETWTKQMLSAIQEEIKDFHGRLCTIEERNKIRIPEVNQSKEKK